MQLVSSFSLLVPCRSIKGTFPRRRDLSKMNQSNQILLEVKYTAFAFGIVKDPTSGPTWNNEVNGRTNQKRKKKRKFTISHKSEAGETHRLSLDQKNQFERSR